MRKVLVIGLLLLAIVGCQKKINVNQDIDNYIKENDYFAISNRIDSIITNLLYFPNQNSEDEFIYYLKSIILNADLFSDEELDNLYHKLSMNYQFEFNSFGYDNDDYNNDLEQLKNLTDKL